MEIREGPICIVAECFVRLITLNVICVSRVESNRTLTDIADTLENQVRPFVRPVLLRK